MHVTEYKILSFQNVKYVFNSLHTFSYIWNIFNVISLHCASTFVVLLNQKMVFVDGFFLEEETQNFDWESFFESRLRLPGGGGGRTVTTQD
jgi:hypothetical protein